MAGPWEEYAQSSTPSGPWQEHAQPTTQVAAAKTKSTSVGELGGALQGGVNRGIAGLAGLPVDTIENVLNLGRAGFGAAATALGKPDLAPELQTGSVGGSQWIASQLQGAGINTQNPRPDDRAARMLYTGGTIAGSSMVPGARPMPTAMSAVSGSAAGEFLGPQWTGVGALGPQLAQTLVSQVASRPLSVREQTARTAIDEGYSLPPTDVRPNLVNRMLEGVSGKIQTRQVQSIQNQAVTDAIAKRSIGLADDAPLTQQAITAVRQDAGRAYEAVKQARLTVQPDQRYVTDLQALGAGTRQAAQDFGAYARLGPIDDLVTAMQPQQMTPAGMVEMVKRLRADATANFRTATGPLNNDPRLYDLARAQRGAADAMDGLLERSLSRAGQRDLATNYAQARQTIARTHDVEAAFNEATGSVSAEQLGRLSARGKPLGGGLEVPAATAQAFPSAMRSLERAGSVPGFSPLDFYAAAGLGIGGSAAAGPTGAMAALLPLIRPAVRAGITSGPYQRGMVMPGSFQEGMETALPMAARQAVIANEK